MGESQAAWGSDVIAEALRATGVRYVALNPGSSYRGLHDSLVNHLGDEDPRILLCLHEEHAVAIAHGYAKVTGVPMAAAVHANVGLMHATMAIYNAWCDRVPMLLLGATGPLDAARRRPWIDWLHTSADQGALVRNYVKWDDQPLSPAAAVESVLRANQLTRSEPSAPVYVCLDVAVQEQPLAGEVPPVDATRYRPLPAPEPAAEALAEAARLLEGADRPVILVGRHQQRDQAALDRRVELAERLGANVITDLKVPSAFPTTHPLHAGWPDARLTPDHRQLIRDADVLLALDWVDLGGALRTVFGGDPPTCTVISCTLDHQLHNGWSKDHQRLAPVDVALPCPPDVAVRALLDKVTLDEVAKDRREPAAAASDPAPGPEVPAVLGADGRISLGHLAREFRAAVGDRPASLVRLPFGWKSAWWPTSTPLDALGKDGGGGVGSGPGMAVGSALALQGSGRLPVAVLGDGDYLMGLTALWTAARYRIPLLVVVANNGSYCNDEVHQERVALQRGRPVENRTVGIRIDQPDPDLALLAAGQGLRGFGPVTDPGGLRHALEEAVDVVVAGGAAVVDVRVERRSTES